MEIQSHPKSEKGNSVTSGKGKGKLSYIRGEKKENPVTSGEGKGKSSYILGGKRKIQLPPGSEKDVTSGGSKMYIHSHPGGKI